MPSPFRDFPADLVRTVCEIAAQDSRKAALKLVLISRNVERWINPILYKFVYIYSNAGANAFLSTIKNSRKPSTFFQSSVKVLLITLPRMRVDTLSQILLACSGVDSLAVWISPQQGTGQTDWGLLSQSLRSSDLQPKRLSYTIHTFRGMNLSFDSAPFLNVTHLELDFLNDVPVWSLENLRLLRNLTHFAVDGLRSLPTVVAATVTTPHPPASPVISFTEKFLTYMPEKLRVLILMFRGADLVLVNHNWLMFECDIRVVFATEHDGERLDPKGCWLTRPYHQEMIDWGDAMVLELDGPDVWGLAEELQQMRREAIENSSPLPR